MKLTVLGCWAPYPAANQACSGYLLEVAGKRILIDLGHGVFGKLQQKFDFSNLDAVFISHLHPDHCADLSCLRHAVLGAKRQGRDVVLPLYTPCEPRDKFEVLADFEDAFDLHVTGTVGCQLKLAGVACEIFPTVHPIPTYGLALEHEGTKFVYTADTAWEDKLVEISRQADILLCEASLAEADAALADKGHLTAGQAGLLASKADAGKLILTHLWPGYNTENLQTEAALLFSGNVELAAEFGKY
jgi:ribonuclease BN (tRNA processing enzyme)